MEILGRHDPQHEGALHDGYFDIQYTPLRAPDGGVEGVLVYAYEVTDKVAARHRIEQQRAKSEDSVRSREDLLAMVSHDLRNPLNAVLISASQIERISDDSETGVRVKRATATIRRAVDRMSRLVGDLLDLAKLEAGRPLPLDLQAENVSPAGPGGDRPARAPRAGAEADPAGRACPGGCGRRPTASGSSRCCRTSSATRSSSPPRGARST